MGIPVSSEIVSTHRAGNSAGKEQGSDGSSMGMSQHTNTGEHSVICSRDLKNGYVCYLIVHGKY